MQFCRRVQKRPILAIEEICLIWIIRLGTSFIDNSRYMPVSSGVVFISSGIIYASRTKLQTKRRNSFPFLRHPNLPNVRRFALAMVSLPKTLDIFFRQVKDPD